MILAFQKFNWPYFTEFIMFDNFNSNDKVIYIFTLNTSNFIVSKRLIRC